MNLNSRMERKNKKYTLQNVAGGDGRVGRLEVQAREGEAGEERVLFEQVAISPSTCPVRQQAAAEEATSTLTHSVQPSRNKKKRAVRKSSEFTSLHGWPPSFREMLEWLAGQQHKPWDHWQMETDI
jgi:hypothetical protein